MAFLDFLGKNFSVYFLKSIDKGIRGDIQKKNP